MSTEEIINYIDSFSDYDIRVTHDCRFVDQKCTPDLVCFIADCILCTECANKEFVVHDLWDQPYFVDNCMVIFGKTSPNNPKAKHEYDKFIVQPLKLLAYAHVLEVRKYSNKLHFKIKNKELLEYISIKERNAFNFLLIFFTKVMKDSGIYRYFEEYEEEIKANSTTAKTTLYDKYHKFIAANTPTKKKLDSDRMLHKVLNVIAYSKGLKGSNGKILSWYDLMYNRVNIRDSKQKQKDETRSEAKANAKEDIKQKFYLTYQINKAIRLVRRMQGDKSEVDDELAAGKATEVHHIFPRSTFPTIATMFENLILLTSSQHHQKAHPNGNTQIISREYQLVCLLAKSQTIEKYIKNINKGFYRKEDFIDVINTGLSEEQIENKNLTFDAIRTYLVHYYQAHN